MCLVLYFPTRLRLIVWLRLVYLILFLFFYGYVWILVSIMAQGSSNKQPTTWAEHAIAPLGSYL